MRLKNIKKTDVKIKVGLSGASGRMGLAVKKLIKKTNSGFVLKAEVSTSLSLKIWEETQIAGVVDFSSPVLFSLVLKWCVAHKKPFVSGTTGLSVAQKRALKIASKKIPVFYEANMSWGIWQIKNWIQNISHQDSEILLEDIHHKHKKDKPSGTALKLQNALPAFAQKKLKIKSTRTGDAIGTHRITFKNKEEILTIEHKALNRFLFAEGSLKALKFLIKKPIGFYSFEDLYK